MIRLLRPMLALSVFLALPALAADPGLGLPLDCRLGESCWVMNFADTDPGPAAKDYTCRPRSYDGHDGTDFAIRDLDAMNRGVRVLASAPGVVVQIRDGEEDGLWIKGERDRIIKANTACGNRVAVKVGENWVTDYCHMKKGSVRVRLGQRVERGQELGLVGLSGMTEFPHVHLGVRQYPPELATGVAVDPFTNARLSQGCGQAGPGLWDPAIAYQPVSLYAAGFAAAMPQPADIKANAGQPAQLSRDGGLVFWVAMLGTAAGDGLTLTIQGPDGRMVGQGSVHLDKASAWQHMALSKPNPSGGWPAGTYLGVARLDRAGLDPVIRQSRIEIR